MIFFSIVQQQYKKLFRARGFYKNLIVNILIGICAAYFAAVLLFLGIFLDNILIEVPLGTNVVETFSNFVIYIMLLAIVVRFFIQNLNTINLKTYQSLPIRRSTLINMLFIGTFFNPLNYIFLLVTIPFAVQAVVPEYGVMAGICFVFSFIFITWFNSLFSAYLKRKYGGKIYGLLIMLIGIAILIGLEYFKIFSTLALSQTVFTFIISHPIAVLLPFICAIGAYLLNFSYFSHNYYSEKFEKKSFHSSKKNRELQFLNRFGMVGEIMRLELKLILRHKRTKNLLYLSVFFLLYEWMFLTMDMYSKSASWIFFAAMFEIGLLMFMYGQWTISWDSSHFDALMTNNIPVKTYLFANLRLLQAYNVVFFILSSPYFFYGPQVIYTHIAAFLFNIGVNSYFLIYFATYNTKRIDLGNSSAFNYQGTTYKNFLIIFPMMFVPMLLVKILSFFTSVSITMGVIGCIGFVGLLLQKPIMNMCYRKFIARKYALSEGFREKE